MNKPTDLSDKYPDCFGAIDRMERDKDARIVRLVSRTLTAIIALIATMVALHYLERFQ